MNRYIILLLVSLLAMQCKEEDTPKEVNQLDLLPAATRTGKYIFGCLVNGKAGVAKTSMDMTAFYQRGVLQIGGSIDEKEEERNITFVIYSDVTPDKVYNLSDVPNSVAKMDRYTNDNVICIYDGDDTIEGTLILTNFDTENYIVSGTFAFTTAKEGCDTIRVTDGRFDMHYIP